MTGMNLYYTIKINRIDHVFHLDEPHQHNLEYCQDSCLQITDKSEKKDWHYHGALILVLD